MYYGLVYAAMQDVVPANLRGAAMGGYSSCSIWAAQRGDRWSPAG